MEEELCDEFSGFDITLSDENVIEKLVQLCQSYSLDPAGIVLEWVAFAHSKKIAPTLSQDSLDILERERLQKKGTKVIKTPQQKKKSKGFYDLNTLDDVMDSAEGDGILDAYSTPKGKGAKKRQLTPDMATNKRLTSLNRTAAEPFSPRSYSPASGTPSAKYSSRTNSGDVVASFGDKQNFSWINKSQRNCSVSHYNQETALTQKFKFMFQKLSDKACVLNDMILHMEKYIQKQYNIEEISHVALPAQEKVTIVGRICCDSVGKLNSKSVLLEGSRETSGGKMIPVDLSNVNQYALFPGQIVAMEGTNSTGMKFVANKILESAPLPLPETKPSLEEGALQVMVAAGPFTTSDNLSYEPLRDFIQYIKKHTPHVVFMIGPFVDSKHKDLEENINEIDMTFEDLFLHTMKQIIEKTENLKTRVIVVPSQRDIHHVGVYPQPPFHFDKLEKGNVTFVSDPCTLDIDGVIFGISAAEVLKNLGIEEISHNPGGTDRLGRLTKHILNSHNFFPLYPYPSDELNIDYDHFETYAKMDVTPHVLVTRSEMKFFIKDIGGCCCVNPERFAKGTVGGTFARLIIKPGGDPKIKSLVPQIAGEIVKV